MMKKMKNLIKKNFLKKMKIKKNKKLIKNNKMKRIMDQNGKNLKKSNQKKLIYNINLRILDSLAVMNKIVHHQKKVMNLKIEAKMIQYRLQRILILM